MNGVVVVLGGPNDEQGNLSEIAKSRLYKGLEEYAKHPGYRMLLTGGFGPHFNTTAHPHAFYARAFLLTHGVAAEDIGPFVLSRNTVEDALLTKSIVRQLGVQDLIVVTSDFHLERARYLFARILGGYHLAFSSAVTPVSAEELAALHAHEAQALARLRTEEHGGYD